MQQQAVLACGLPEDSRTIKELTGRPDQKTILMAAILDEARLLTWSKTKAARKNQNRPKSVLKALITAEKPKDKTTSGLKTFGGGAEFEAFRKTLIEKIRNSEDGGQN